MTIMNTYDDVTTGAPDIRSFEDWVAYSKGVIVRLQRDGTITIPKKFRQQLGLTVESTLVVRIDEYRGGIYVNCLGKRSTNPNESTR